MALETEIKKLTAALTANTAAVNSLVERGTAAPAPAAAPTPAAKPAAKSEGSDAPTSAPEPSDAAPTVDKKKLSQKFIEVAQSQGRDVAVQMLAEYGVDKLPKLPADKWDEFYEKCETALLVG